MRIVDEMISFNEVVYSLEKVNGLINQFINLTKLIGMLNDVESQKIAFDFRIKVKEEVVEANDNLVKIIEVFHKKKDSDYQDYLSGVKTEIERLMNLDFKTNLNFKEAGNLEKEIDVFKSYIEQFDFF